MKESIENKALDVNEVQTSDESSSRTQFERELAAISFQELQKFFAKGMLIKVANHLDMIEVAMAIHNDNAAQVKIWMKHQELERANDDHAKVWIAKRSHLNAVTVAPWVLVQDIKEEVK